MRMKDRGVVSILNAGAGDLRISFNSKKREEVQAARQMVTDLLKQGYAIVVEDENGDHQVVREFDPATNEYIVTGPSVVAAPTAEETPAEPAATKPKAQRRRIRAGSTRATAIAPSAGG